MEINLEKLRLVALSETFSDEEVEKSFLELEVESEEEIQEALAILQKYRPEIVKRLDARLKGRKI